MLMHPRQPFPLLFDADLAQNPAPTSVFFDTQPYSSFDPAPTDFVQPSFSFDDAGAASPAFVDSPMSGDSLQTLARTSQSQDWPAYTDTRYNMSRLGHTSQPPRKRFRPSERAFSDDLKSPAAFSQHLPTPTQTPTQAASPLDAAFYNRQAPNAMAAALRMSSAMDQQQLEAEMPGYAHSGRSVSSYGHDSPATPRTMIDEDRDEGMNAVQNDFPTVPKFERTMTDVYNDELYSPASFASQPSANYTPVNSAFLSPYRNSMNERLHAANEARSVSPMDTSPRIPSPFCQNSRFHPPTNPFGQGHTAAGLRQQQKAQADAFAYQQHHTQPDNAEPPTISPKDAVLDYHEDAQDQATPLFPQTPVSEAEQQQSYGSMSSNLQSSRHSSYSMQNSGFTFASPAIPASAQSSDMLYLSRPFRTPSNTAQVEEPRLPPRLVSMESSASDVAAENMQSSQDSSVAPIRKPINTSASRGSYACTAPNCTQRFDSAGRLQKHKHDEHKPAASHVVQREPSTPGSDSDASDAPDSGIGSNMSSTALMQRNAQAGPHRCNRINPATGKPCSTVFSRPYDLTRHEDTIHNNQKKKVRCHLCTEDKSFSRSDALTRHMRVVHPEVNFPGKHRRRHHD